LLGVRLMSGLIGERLRFGRSVGVAAARMEGMSMDEIGLKH
jgi:hypothetical protein